MFLVSAVLYYAFQAFAFALFLGLDIGCFGKTLPNSVSTDLTRRTSHNTPSPDPEGSWLDGINRPYSLLEPEATKGLHKPLNNEGLSGGRLVRLSTSEGQTPGSRTLSKVLNSQTSEHDVDEKQQTRRNDDGPTSSSLTSRKSQEVRLEKRTFEDREALVRLFGDAERRRKHTEESRSYDRNQPPSNAAFLTGQHAPQPQAQHPPNTIIVLNIQHPPNMPPSQAQGYPLLKPQQSYHPSQGPFNIGNHEGPQQWAMHPSQVPPHFRPVQAQTFGLHPTFQSPPSRLILGQSRTHPAAQLPPDSHDPQWHPRNPVSAIQDLGPQGILPPHLAAGKQGIDNQNPARPIPPIQQRSSSLPSQVPWRQPAGTSINARNRDYRRNKRGAVIGSVIGVLNPERRSGSRE